MLFYKTDTTEHREKLRTIFPYVLGAVNPETLAQRHQLKLIRRELRRKEDELKNVRAVSQRWVAEAQARVSEAIELGLLDSSTPRPQTHAQAIDLLRRVLNQSRSETSVTADSISDAVSELTSLNEEEAEISQDVSRLRRRFEEMSQLKSSAAQYRGALRVQQDRLAVADWVQRQQETTHSCPMCGSNFDIPNRELTELLVTLRQIEGTATQFDGIPASFDREFERVRAEISERSERLRGVRIRIRDLERRSEEARQRQYSLLMASRFLGRLESDLGMLESVGQDSELQGEVDELRERVQALEAQISEAQIRRRVDRALDVVNQYAGRLMPGLDTERPNDPVALSDSELTIKVRSVDREDFLWEIGSGSNWLSYHVSMTLALQQFFLTLPHSPVPSFLVFD